MLGHLSLRRAPFTPRPNQHFSSYTCHGHSASECASWEVARATSAAPTFFKPITLDDFAINPEVRRCQRRDRALGDNSCRTNPASGSTRLRQPRDVGLGPFPQDC
jgi:hypothetical protein